ncbi:ELWxxDGT repeat protein [Novipirellula sp. SH528]|uniref:ELWxxDGT repeat protein n=1 Tax=Novipirellula sp. SH528 TaxID=3454466 RepID=UPI003FA18B62
MRPLKSPSRLIARRRLLLEVLEDRRLLAGVSNLTPATYDLRNVIDLDNTVTSSSPTAAIQIGSTYYFAATTPTHGSELWKSDGTNDGTSQVIELADGSDSSNPRSLYAWNSALYFIADYSYLDPGMPPGGIAEIRTALFRSDGTETGTMIVHSFDSMGGAPGGSPGGDSTTFYSLGSQLLFLRPDSMGMGGHEVWKSNGISGASMIASIPGSGFGAPASSGAIPSATLGSVLLFNLNVDSAMGSHQLWRTDGTATGTYMLRDSEMSFGPGSIDFDGSIVTVGSTAYFVSTSMMEGQELWRTDGTLSGTGIVGEIVSGDSGSQIGSMVAFQNQLYFTANDLNPSMPGPATGRELYRTDPTTNAITRITDIVPSYGDGVHGTLFAWQGHLYFAGGDGGSGDGIELWKSDGTALGTSQVADIAPGISGFYPASSIPHAFYDLGSRLVFRTIDYGALPGQLWSTDGTAVGTIQLTTTATQQIRVAGNRVFFTATTGASGSELWVSDGTAAGTAMVKDLNPGTAGSAITMLAATSTGVIFQGSNPSVGVELGISDGTASGTRLIDVARGTPAANIRKVLKVGNDFYISTGFTSPTFTDKLYRTNAVTGVTTLLKSFSPGNGPTELAFGNGVVYFAAEGSSAQGRELWLTDGTVAGTKLSKDIRTGATGSDPRKLTSFDDRVFFVVDGASGFEELWVTNGGDISPANYVAQFNTAGDDGDIESITPVGERLYVIAGDQLHRFNRSVNGGTTKVTLGATRQRTVMPWNNIAYFAGYDPAHGDELWRTDGTVGGTYLLKDLLPGPESSYPGGGVATSGVSTQDQGTGSDIESKLIFGAHVSTNSYQLWSTDGTSAGTKALTSVFEDDGLGNVNALAPISLVALGDKVLFEGYSPGAGRELWVSSGTVAGTGLLADLRPGVTPDPNDPFAGNVFVNMREMTSVGELAFFRTTDPVHGSELWVTDGTTAGSRLAVDIMAGTASGSPTNLLADNGRLYLTADTLDYGVTTSQLGGGELFYVNQSPRITPLTTVGTVNTMSSIPLTAVDRDGDTVTLEIASQPANGTATIVGGVLHYTPNTGFVGLDSLTYRAFDGSLVSAAATVKINVQSAPYTASFASATTSVIEQNGQVQITVNLDRIATQPVIVPYSISGDTENLVGSYSGGDLYIAANQSSGVITLSLQEDSRYEVNPDLLVITLDDAGFVNLGAIAAHTLSITDNDSIPTIRFDRFTSSVTESDISTSIDVILSGPSEAVVTTNVSISQALGAIAGVDFIVPSLNTLTFLPGQIRKTLPIRIVQDSVAENRELIIADLTTIVGATLASEYNSWKHLLWIDDDDTSVVSVTPEYQYTGEGETATITAKRTGGNLSTSLVIPFTYYARGATFGVDYTANQALPQFTFAPGNDTAQVSFTLVDDTLDENYEAFEVILTPGSYTLSGSGSGWVVIGDNDSSTPAISLASSSVSERAIGSTNRKVDVIVTLSNPSVDTVTVPIRVSNESGKGTAKLNTDFQFNTANFVFAPGVTEMRRAVTIIDDLDVEPNETIRFTLGNSLFTGPLWQDKQSVELTIEDDEFNSRIIGPSTVSENIGSFTFKVTKETNNNISGDVSIRVGGSALLYGSQRDVSIASLNGTFLQVSFGTAQKEREFTVNVVNDAKVEGPETLVFEVGRNFGSQFKVLSTHTVTIADDDRRPSVSFGPTGGFGLTETTTVKIPVKLSAPLTEPAKVYFRLDGDARQGVDYRLEGVRPGTLAIDLGVGQDTGYVTIQPLPQSGATADKRVDVVIVGALAIDIPSNPPKSSHVILGNKTKTTPKVSIPSSTNYNPMAGGLAIGEYISLGGTTTNIASSGEPVVTITTTNAETFTPFTIALAIGQQGLLEGSTAFFDANFNGVRDFIDLDEDGRRDEDEPLEPQADTNLDGSFAIAMISELDRNQDGVIDSTEGRIVVTGGVDTSTGLPWELPLSATTGNYIVTPLSTLVENYARRYNQTPQQASERVQQALRIEGFDFSLSDPIARLLAGDGVAKQVYVQLAQVSSLLILLGRFAEGASGESFAGLSQLVTNALVDRLAPSGSVLDLTDASLVRAVANSVNQSLVTPIPAATINDISTLIAERLGDLQSLASTTFASEQAFLEELTRYKKTLHGSMASDVRDVGSGAKTSAEVATTYATSQIAGLAATQTIGQVVPTMITLGDAAIIEGTDGETNVMRFEVALTGDHTSQVSVAFATRDYSATAGIDYGAVSGVLTWPAGDNTSRFVDVTVHGDSAFEVDELLVLGLENATDAVIRRAAGYGYILNDDTGTHTITSTAPSETSIAHSRESLSVSTDQSVVTDGYFTRPTSLSIVGAVDQPNTTIVNFGSASYRGDHYTIQGGTQADSLRLAGGQFSRLAVRPTINSQTLTAITPDNTAIVMDTVSVESSVAEVSSVETVEVYIPSSVTTVIVDDADGVETGLMRVRSVSGEFLPIVFTNPTVGIKIVTINPALVIQRPSTDSLFVGTVTLDLISTSLTLDTENTSTTTLIGGWSPSVSTPGFEGANYLYTTPGSNSTATFTPTIAIAGQYEVFMKYSSHANRASNAKVSVTHADGTFAILQNQKTGGGVFQSLGLFNFETGTAGHVSINGAGSNGYVTADAVRLVRIGDTVSAPSASLANPTSGQRLTDAALNANGFIEVTFNSTVSLDTSTIVDAAPEFTLSGPGVGTAVINGNGVLQSGTTYRYAFSGQFVPGDVVVNFIAGAFANTSASGNLAGQESFTLTDGIVRITLDNTDATQINHWAVSTAIAGYVGPNYLYNNAGGAGRLVYTPTIPTDGFYEVFVNYTGGSSRASNAAYEVVSQNGTSVVRVDQRTGGGVYQSLGTFNFLAGTSGSVTLRASDANGFVVGDAVQFVRVGNTTGTPTATLADPVAGASIVVTAINGRDYLDVTFSVNSGASLNVSTITDAQQEFTLSGAGAAGVTVNGEPTLVSGTTYRYATTGDFSPGAVDAVFAAGTFADQSGNANIDSIESFVVAEDLQEEVIVDNSGPGFTLSGPSSQFFSSSSVGGFVGSNYLAAQTGSTATATWTPTLAHSGQQYQVYVRYTSHALRATNATYVVTHNGGTTQVIVNQKSGGGTWVLLGTFMLTNGTASVQLLTQDANQYVVADAVRFVLM